jgi:hypothetical protein
MKQFRDTPYYVTEDGKVISTKFGKTKELKSVIHTTGYCYVELFQNKIGTMYRIHRLVAECYLPNPENKLYVNHINGIKNDNKVSNLEWCTHVENEYHKRHILNKNVIGSNVFGSKLQEEDVRWILLNKDNFSTKYFSKKFKVSETTIRQIKNKKTWKHI